MNKENIIYDIDNYCIHIEMNHGPMLLDNNISIGDTYGVEAKGADFSLHKGGEGSMKVWVPRKIMDVTIIH